MARVMYDDKVVKLPRPSETCNAKNWSSYRLLAGAELAGANGSTGKKTNKNKKRANKR